MTLNSLNSSNLIHRGPICESHKSIQIIELAERSLLRIKTNQSLFGSAFLGETPDHLKVLFTVKHIFPTDSESYPLIFNCSNSAEVSIFDIDFENYNNENIFLNNNPDSAAIILNDEIVKKCEKRGSVFVNIGEFVPNIKPISIYGFPLGGPYSFSTGWITEGNEHEFKHSAGSLNGNSGSLILENDGNVAGIHCGTEVTHNIGKATNINFVTKQITSQHQPYFSSSDLWTYKYSSNVNECCPTQSKKSALCTGAFCETVQCMSVHTIFIRMFLYMYGVHTRTQKYTDFSRYWSPKGLP